MTALPQRVESTILKALGLLPRPVHRVLGGRPTTVDGNTLAPDLQLLLRLQNLTRDSLEPSVAGGRAGMRRDAITAGGRQSIGRTQDLEVDGAEGPRPARLYVPKALLASSSDPLLVFLHGGGYTFGDLESHDAVCRFLAERAGVRVLSVDYRLAPEHPFPAGLDDAWAAVQWAHANAAAIGADPGRVAIGGDSAGANLSSLCAIRAAEQGLPLRMQLLIYPGCRHGDSGPSKQKFGEGFVLTGRAMDFFEECYLGGRLPLDPVHSPGQRDSFPEGLAPVVIAIAGFDPLRDEERDFVELLEKHGVPVTERFFPHLTHGFANMLTIGSCRKAMEQLAADLRSGLR